MRMVKAEYTGVNFGVCKVEYQAIIRGVILEIEEKFGVQVEIIGENEKLTEEIKRIGFLIDRKRPIQLRKGDRLVLYLSKPI